MLQRVTRLSGAPCLFFRGTLLGRLSFCHVNGSYRDNPNSRCEINRENMAARGELFRSYYLPVLSAEENDSQSEEILVIDQSQAETRPVPVQEAEIRCQITSVNRPSCLLCLAGAEDSLLPIPLRLAARKGGLCFYVSTLLPPCKQALNLFDHPPPDRLSSFE